MEEPSGTQSEIALASRSVAGVAVAAAAAALRVVSVLPSATEALAFIGGADLLVGRSPRTIFRRRSPPSILTGQKAFTTAADVDKQVSEALSSGQSLYTLDEALLRELKPDVILTQDLCEVCAIDLKTVERIAQSLDPQPKSCRSIQTEDVLNSLQTIGDAVGAPRPSKSPSTGCSRASPPSPRWSRRRAASTTSAAASWSRRSSRRRCTA